MSHQRRLCNFIYKGEERLIGLEIFLKSKKDSFIPIGDIERVLSSFNSKIRHIECSSCKEGETLVFIVVKVEAEDMELDKLVDALKKDLKDVSKVQLSPSVWNQFIFSRDLFPLTVGENRAAILDNVFLESMITGARESLGEDLAASLAYHLGVLAGREGFERYYLGKNLADVDEVFRFSDAILGSYGWGRILEYEFKKDALIIRIEKLFECEVLKDKVDKPASSFFRGLMEGFASKYFGSSVVVKETKCIAVGDPYCEFVVSII